MYSGFYITLETKDSTTRRFVVPAIVAETVSALITKQQNEDPQDEMSIKIYWGKHSMRPDYTVIQAPCELWYDETDPDNPELQRMG